MNLSILSFPPLDASELFLFSYIIPLSLTPPKVIFVHNYYSFVIQDQWIWGHACHKLFSNFPLCVTGIWAQSQVKERSVFSGHGGGLIHWQYKSGIGWAAYVYIRGKQICGAEGESTSEEKQVCSAECVKVNSQNCSGWKWPLGIM